MPAVSIIMNCLNGEAYLREALDSAFSQTFEDWEIVFWDNASTDSSAEIARSYGEKVRYFRGREKTTLGEARNRAFAQARGRFLAILDTDDIWMPAKLEKQVCLFDDPEVGLVFSNARAFDSSGDRYVFFQKQPPGRGMVFAPLLENNFMPSPTIMFRHDAIRGMGQIFDAQFTIVCDYELTLRIASRHKVDYLDECLAKWRLHAESESVRKPFLLARENALMLEKFKRDMPNLEQNHPEAVRGLQGKVDLCLGQEAWLDGDVQRARSLFRPYLANNWKHLVAYAGTWVYPFPLSPSLMKQFRALKQICLGR